MPRRLTATLRGWFPRPFAGLTKRNLLREAGAGVTLLAIAVPLNIGYAQIVGLPPTVGLYALVLPLIVWALTVSSRQLVASPDAAAAALVATSIGGLAIAGTADYLSLVLAQTVLCGALFLVAAVFRLGFLADFLSKPILVGLLAGLALDILVGQVAKMLGISVPPGGEFFEKLLALVTGLGAANVWSAMIAAGCLVVLLLGRRLAPAVPWALVVLVLATLATTLGGLEARGVATLGPVEGGLPELHWPVVAWTDWAAVLPSAIALFLVGAGEGLLVSRAYADKRGYRVDANRDLFAFGLANVASGATGSFAMGSSTARTAALDQAGSRTQFPAVIAAVGATLLLVFGTGLLEHVPGPAIGAVLAVAVLPLLGIGDFAELWRRDRAEFAIAGVCFGVTVVFGSIVGIGIAFVLALVNLARRAASPDIDVLSLDEYGASSAEGLPLGRTTAPGIVVVRLAAPLFFANGTVFQDTVQRTVEAAEPPVRHVVFDMEAVSDVDITGAEAFARLRSWLLEHDIDVSYSRMRHETRERMQHLGLLHGEAVHHSNREALAALGARPNPRPNPGPNPGDPNP
ncbi:SulP family inorganic anion transporter [Agromyces lapidis]|uniref:SulP family inorganic anion transporter n=1 Tax=Agromyces lapidis TaxID=279574 RepID=A0ABV5STL2_9MICO|nr:SulP family inorganic anion transporter [Agromyces lapidis]